MTSNPVKPSDLSEYLDKEIERVEDNGILFEALCEKIVELNNEAKVQNMAEEYEETSDTNPEEFVSSRFERYVHEDTYKVISYAHRNKWIQYTIHGLVEYGVADPEYLDSY